MAAIVKTIDGLALSSVKTFNGLAAASLKSVNGQDATSGGATPDLVNEGFEGTGLPSGWSTAIGSPNYDYTTTPLAGAQSLHLPSGSGTLVAPGSLLNVAECWFKWRMRVDTLPGTSFAILNTDDGGFGFNATSVILHSSGALELANGFGTPATTVSTMSIATAYDCFGHFNKGSGSNSISEFSFVTAGGSRPNAGNSYITITNGTITANCQGVEFIAGDSAVLTIDSVQFSSTDIF